MLKTVTIFAILILLFAASQALAQQTAKQAISDYSGSWNFENKVKPSKKNKGKIELISFSVNIKQEGDKISGRYEYLTTNATRIREGNISGKILGIKAVIKFDNTEYLSEKGLAELFLNKNELSWITIQMPEGDTYIPLKTTLKKKN
jgi:hypothetical protein